LPQGENFWAVPDPHGSRLAGQQKLIGSGQIQRHFFRGHSRTLAQT
jgi:hypothetical protein